MHNASTPSPAKIGIFGLMELVLWVVPAGAFLAIYVDLFGEPFDAIAPHLTFLLTLWLASVCLRVLIWRHAPTALVASFLNASLMGWLAVAILTYYTLVLIGLRSWGRVITWELIVTYSRQAGHLLTALGIDRGWLVAGTGAILLGAPLVVWHASQQTSWTRGVAGIASGWTLRVACAAGLAGSAIYLYQFAADPPVHAREPVSLTFFPLQAQTAMQSHGAGTSSVLDAREDHARARYKPNPEARPRNVILIVGDALRPDHLGPYGYSRNTTPFLDVAVRNADTEVVKHMSAICAESTCGLMGILQSKYVHQFSVRAFTLFDVLRLHGYEIRMILGGDHTNFYGLKAAYGQVDSYVDGSSSSTGYMKDDEFIVDQARNLPPSSGRPQFIQFHLMSSHGLGKRQPEHQHFQPSINYYRLPEPKTNDKLPAAVNFYDNGIRQFDEVAHRILQILKDKGYLREALVIITSDHGEMLGEHGLFSHSKSVHEPALRIPFIVMRHGYRPSSGKIAEQRVSSQIDIAPTIAAEMDIPPPESWSGTPLQHGPRRPYIQFQQGPEIGIFDLTKNPGPVKFWLDTRDNSYYYYNLSLDPQEKFNLGPRLSMEQVIVWQRTLLDAIAAYSRRQP